MLLSDLMSNSITLDTEDNIEETNNHEFWLHHSQCFDLNLILEMPTWINSKKSSFQIPALFNSSINDKDNVNVLNIEQRKAFDLVHSHFHSSETSQLLLLITGKAGYGKVF